MKARAARYERFMRDASPIRLGGIAADLARIASFASNPANRQAILDMLEESKWFIEWTAPSEEPSKAARLVEIQVSLALMEYRLHRGDLDFASLSRLAAEWSDEVLGMSGLLE